MVEEIVPQTIGRGKNPSLSVTASETSEALGNPRRDSLIQTLRTNTSPDRLNNSSSIGYRNKNAMPLKQTTTLSEQSLAGRDLINACASTYSKIKIT